CTASYREFRNRVRAGYGSSDPDFNPGGGWVSRLCFEPRVGLRALESMLPQEVEVLYGARPIGAQVDRDIVRSVTLEVEGEHIECHAKIVLDATETGELLPLTGAEYVLGSESRARTGEAHAGEEDRPDNLQALTWCFALAHDAGSNRAISRPQAFDRWRSFQPDFWPGPLLGEVDLDPISLKPRRLPFMSEEGLSWFGYRQVRRGPGDPVTIVNWPMNDYFIAPVVDVPRDLAATRLQDAKELGLCLLFWLQTEMGLNGLYLRPDITGTGDGFAMAPYHRESRRIMARFTVAEELVSAEANPGHQVARKLRDTVGIGAYRIDLHPSTGGDNYVDLASLPFQIPLGALIPIRVRNLLPACKNIGTTHITNGCYRLHPVEWNIGEAAGQLAAHCLETGLEASEVWESENLTGEFQNRLLAQGFELEWPELPAV
ncbi:MAG TPA: FAD-dependent oxidoreductase, partial [Gemmatimonadales bacterium]|nr:FAD-dependent oxidoreductase [Gemmatimonadales bacterium]